jgi:GNAT superfamily N-acetyltransferase
VNSITYATFEPHHVADVMRLTTSQGWPTLAEDGERAVRVLLAPGAVTVIAIDGEEVVGFARALCDGEWIACLTDMVVAESHRRRGVGRGLIAEVFRRSGAERMDLLAEPGSEVFYESHPHRRWTGYRLYPSQATEA